MITVSVKDVLLGLLLIALIVLVIFLIVLISNITDTIKKANSIIDSGTTAAGNAKAKVDNVSTIVKENAAKAKGVAAAGASIAQKLLEKILK